MLIKTSEAIGSQLDWLVAKCEGWELADSDKGTKNLYYKWPDGSLHVRDLWHPSTDWSQAGTIIERERIKVFPNVGGTWSAQIRHTKSHSLVSHPVLAGWTNSSGPTPLIAAMRCLVASRLGDEVEIPDELQGVT